MPVGSHEVMGLGTPVKLDLATATTSDRVPDGTTEPARDGVSSWCRPRPR